MVGNQVRLEGTPVKGDDPSPERRELPFAELMGSRYDPTMIPIIISTDSSRLRQSHGEDEGEETSCHRLPGIALVI